MTALLTHRHTAYELVPKWARGFFLGGLLYAINLVFDELYDMLLAAVWIRFPNRYSPESMRRLGSERGLRRAPLESDDSYADYLKRWWDLSKTSGTFWSLLERVQHFFAPAGADVRVVCNDGRYYRIAPNGDRTKGTTSWNWDGHSEKWSRFWLIIDNTDVGATGTDRKVLQPGDTVRNDDYLVGSDVLNRGGALSYALPDAKEIQAILEAERCPHAFCDCVIVILDSNAFWENPPNTGDWDRWVRRSTQALYWEGTPA